MSRVSSGSRSRGNFKASEKVSTMLSPDEEEVQRLIDNAVAKVRASSSRKFRYPKIDNTTNSQTSSSGVNRGSIVSFFKRAYQSKCLRDFLMTFILTFILIYVALIVYSLYFKVGPRYGIWYK